MKDLCAISVPTATLANLQTFPVPLASAQETVMSAIVQQESVLTASTIPLVLIVDCVLMSSLEMQHSKHAKASIYSTDSGVSPCCTHSLTVYARMPVQPCRVSEHDLPSRVRQLLLPTRSRGNYLQSLSGKHQPVAISELTYKQFFNSIGW